MLALITGFAQDDDRILSPPTAQLYADCCDEFFFGLGSHIPKTLWRRQLPLLHVYIDVVLRRPLIAMLGWEVGTRTGFNKSIGKAGNGLQDHLPAQHWQQLLRTYSDSEIDHIWESIMLLYELFMSSAESVAGAYNFRFPAEVAKNAWAFAEHVHELPRDAISIY